MAILVDNDTRLLVQGITGREGAFHTGRMLESGTNVVAGVTPGKGGQDYEGVPVFNTVEEAVGETGANASVIFVPPPFAADAIFESLDGGLSTVCCITEGIPVHDMMRSEEHTSELQSRQYLVCRLLLEKKKTLTTRSVTPASRQQRPSPRP